ncbi:Uridine kinase [Hanseniaspora osmophila]|uniref:Uridine kinase n=1 Tax=Hanseniaspora osmophila TaxID=56408 RepID=A0A1E5RET5_9ASCO|nr:Uridine kinase [Hanseniaspora osmophila]
MSAITTQHQQPYIIGVGGPSGSGKTSVASCIVKEINSPNTVLVTMDNFYNPLSEEQHNQALENNFDFDNPDAIDMESIYQCLKNLKKGLKVDIPVYSFIEHNRVPNEKITIQDAHIIVLEGIYALYDPKILEMMDLKIYVDADLDICLARRLTRDILSRGRDLDGCLKQWTKFVKPDADKFVRPTVKAADVIIPNFIDSNSAGIRVVISHLKNKLEEKEKMLENGQSLDSVNKEITNEIANELTSEISNTVII